MTRPTIFDAVSNDLCIGCGLCEAVAPERAQMKMTDAGSLRPSSTELFTASQNETLAAACPGLVAAARPGVGSRTDSVWGHYQEMAMAWAGDPTVRLEASTGGVLSALGQHLVASQQVGFVLHVGPDPDHPIRNRWVLSETPAEILANAGSRYSPTAPLAGLPTALERGERFAIIAKPCDLGALYLYGQSDPRVDELCVIRLAMVCGGQSRLSKTVNLLAECGLGEDDVAALRYRGFGNPGLTQITATDGSTYTRTYQQLWEDAATWDVETRCKFCPDALGECADIAAADAWPGGGPTGEDEGFNAVVVRTAAGQRLFDEAVTAGAVVRGDELTAEDLNGFQPHQVDKKEALAARYQGLADADVAPIATDGLRIDSLGQRLSAAQWEAERDGARQRIIAARQ